MAVRAILRTVHAWTGVACGLVLAVLGLSGTLLVFRYDYLRLTLPGADVAPVASAAELGVLLEGLEARHGDALRAVTFGSADMGLHTAGFAAGAGAYLDATGEAVTSWARNGRPEQWLFDLHHHLLAGRTGEEVAAWLGLVLMAMAISGIVLWTPWQRLFRLRAWPQSAGRRDVVAQHRDLGLVAALPLLVLAVTGSGMVFRGQTLPLLGALTGSNPAPRIAFSGGAGDVAWPRALATAQALYPDAELRAVTWPGRTGATATIRLRQPGEWTPNGRTVVHIDPATGAVAGSVDAMAQSRADRVFNTFGPIHDARVGGLAWKLLSAAAGLGLTLLGTLAAFVFLRARLRRDAGEAVAVPGGRAAPGLS